MPFDFGTMTDVKETDQGQAVATTKFDFSSAEDIPQEIVAPKSQSPISKVMREVTKHTPAEKFRSLIYLSQHIPSVEPGESISSYNNKLGETFKKQDEEIINRGIGSVLAGNMTAAIPVGLVTNPVETAIFIGGAELKDKFINLRRLVEEKAPNTSPLIKDVVELVDMGLTAGLLGKGIYEGKKAFKSAIDSAGNPRNVNVSPDIVDGIKNSGNFTIEEKADIMQTLGIEQRHIDASVSGGVPINVPTSKIMDLAEKPYWEIAKHELLGGEKGETKLDLFGQPIQETPIKVSQEVLADLKTIQTEKSISGVTMKRLKNFAGIENIKKSPEPLVKKLVGFVEDLKPEDKFLSADYDKTTGELIGGQLFDLKEIIKELPNPEVTPKRIVLEKFGEKKAILSEGIMSKVMPELIPTVDIKQGHPLITRIVEKVSDKMIKAEDLINKRNEKLDKMVTAAEKSRDPLLPLEEKLKRKVYPQNKEIFQALGGKNVQLTKEETAVVAYLKDFFEKAKNELRLEKYRKNYVTHLEQPLTEKILMQGLFKAVKDIFRDPRKTDLPVDIMLELDNIIGSEKFFKFALERKGGIEPTTNIREIINQYSHLYETKKVLDEVLPEGQAITKNLLEGKSAVWMKKYLQNLKGRGLDNNFKNGPMGWLGKTADAIVDVGYLKLLALNWKSMLKNIVAGEANSWIYQDFPTYLKGKERFFSNPKKAYALATEYGALEGTYSDFAQKGIGALKKYQDWAMIGQKVGEIEIRSSIFSSMLTEKEWKTGKIEPSRFNEIKDVIAKTQGIFSKWDSPLLLQTWYGRMFFQMNRWRITNAMLLKDIVGGASKDIKAGNFKTQNVTRLGKALVAYGTGMYLSYQLGMAGFRTAASVSKNMAQTIDGIMSLFTEGELVKMFTDNPTLQVFQEISNTIQNTAKYLHVPGAKKTKEKGIEDTYIAPIETTKDILDTLNV